MKVLLNNEVREELSDIDTFNKLLEAIRSKLDSEIIEKIYLDDVEVNESYLINNEPEIEKISELKLITKKNEELILETLEEADDYLPNLKEGVMKTSELFRKGDNEEANLKYQLCLEGLEWYINVLQRILSLIEAEKLKEEIQSCLSDINNMLVDLMKAYKNEDIVFVADLLEYEIADYIDEFIEFNKELKETLDFDKS